MQDDFFLESIYRRFDAAIDRIDSRERSPTPREAGVLTQVLDQLKAENFERASELLDALNQAVVASSLVTNGDEPVDRSHHDTGASQQNERDPDPSDVAKRRPAIGQFPRQVLCDWLGATAESSVLARDRAKAKEPAALRFTNSLSSEASLCCWASRM
jgi:hypothetical protein